METLKKRKEIKKSEDKWQVGENSYNLHAIGYSSLIKKWFFKPRKDD